MTREERLKTDPIWAAEYHRKARERQRRRTDDPVVYAEILRKNKERQRAKRGPRPPIPTEKACTRCGVVKPFTSDFYSPRKDGRAKLTSHCRVCHARIERLYYAENREKRVQSVYRSLKKRLQADPVFRAKQRERVRDHKRKTRADPVKNEALLAKDRAWRKANWDRVKRYKHKSGALQVHHVAMRHAAKLRATPAWADLDAIAAIYERCRQITEETGIEHHVDHKIPLRGRIVCGLHVEANLQILPAELNKRKANRLLE